MTRVTSGEGVLFGLRMWRNGFGFSVLRSPHPTPICLRSSVHGTFPPSSSAGRIPQPASLHTFSSLSSDSDSDIATMTITLNPDFGANDHLFPPLPRIRSFVIERQVFTHRSFFARAAHVFEDPIDDLSPDNEKFELLGDSVLQACITTLLMELFPGLRVGPATKVRAMVVANLTLAQISVKYKLQDRLRLHPAQAITLRASTNIRANIFEAFVGGLYKDQGLETVMRWVYPLFRPYAIAAYTIAREQHGLPPVQCALHTISPRRGSIVPQASPHPEPNELANMPVVGHLALFNQHLQKMGKSIEWNYTDEMDARVAPSTRGTKATPVWAVSVYVDGQFLGSGKGATKKVARNEAAKAALILLGIEVW
ncbi:hypothetical protein D9613_004896 [Agrocybe pediades]|uniref:Uncharacterized protein n=1 Tax=Agrocybe pediades TaxID=84607 RepID=A0A8H4R0D3_9AGAR|nr:hypothetical protein D9613_004896 [Agrocybe pediades]